MKVFIDELKKAVNCPEEIDVYSYIAHILLNKDYSECTEFDMNNCPNIEGHHLRQVIKLMIIDVFIHRRDDTPMFSDGKPTLEFMLFKQFPKLFDLLEIDDWE